MSLAVTKCGSHAAVALSNGDVILYPCDAAARTELEPCYIGSIVPKGMHTRLELMLDISEDDRYLFAGVLRGSSEMLVANLTPLTESQVREICYKVHDLFQQSITYILR